MRTLLTLALLACAAAPAAAQTVYNPVGRTTYTTSGSYAATMPRSYTVQPAVTYSTGTYARPISTTSGYQTGTYSMAPSTSGYQVIYLTPSSSTRTYAVQVASQPQVVYSTPAYSASRTTQQTSSTPTYSPRTYAVPANTQSQVVYSTPSYSTRTYSGQATGQTQVVTAAPTYSTRMTSSPTYATQTIPATSQSQVVYSMPSYSGRYTTQPQVATAPTTYTTQPFGTGYTAQPQVVYSNSRTYTSPTQTYTAPTQTFTAPVQTYTAPVYTTTYPTPMTSRSPAWSNGVARMSYNSTPTLFRTAPTQQQWSMQMQPQRTWSQQQYTQTMPRDFSQPTLGFAPQADFGQRLGSPATQQGRGFAQQQPRITGQYYR